MARRFDSEALHHSLAALIPAFPEARLCVALSGGVDSMALLHAAHELAGREPGLALRALHVDHGLQEGSGEWAGRCAAACRALGVPLEVIRLKLQVAPGASVEAEARGARYRALAERLGGGEWLLTAHHADDQLETVLLQLLRGAGVAGLAAMPRSAPLGRGLHLRPMLEFTRGEVEAYAAQAGLEWVEDPMNREARYDRAWLRREVLPALRARWPAAARSASRSAAHLGEARALLDSLADEDLAALLDEGRLDITALRRLSRPRQANAVRRWLAQQGLGHPPTSRLDALLDEAATARADAEPVVGWGTGEVRRYRDFLYAMLPLGPVPLRDWTATLAPGAAVELPCGLGRLALGQSSASGVASAALRGAMQVRFRQGGERLRPVGRGPEAHTLKNLCQEAGIVPWMRSRLPLLWHGTELVAVGSLWVDQAFAPQPGEPGWTIAWDPPARLT